MALLRRLLAIALFVATPALAGEFYFSDCDYDQAYPTCTPLNSDTTLFKCEDVADGWACGDNDDDPDDPDDASSYVSSACDCPYVSAFLCSEWALMQSEFTAGSKNNPWCLSPESGGSRNSFAAMSDGGTGTYLNDEMAAGDTIYMCCGACDGQGSCTWEIQCSGVDGTGLAHWNANYFMRPLVNAGATPITITVYPGEDVTLSGDSNGDGAYTGSRSVCNGTSDVAQFMSKITGSLANASSGYVLKGFKAKKFGNKFITSWNGLNDFVVDHMTVSEVGSGAWGKTVTGVGTLTSKSLCDSGGTGGTGVTGNGTFGIYMEGNTGGDFLIKDSVFHTNCGMWLRDISNTGGTFTVQDSEFYNNYQVSNDWGNWNWETDAGETVTYRRNYFHDNFGVISLEDRNKGAVIEDNVIACLGQYDISTVEGYGPMCRNGIYISGGDYSERQGTNAGHTIRRNRIFGTATTATHGRMDNGITYDDSCRSNSLCEGAGDPWCCCTGVGAGVCNSASAGGTCSEARFKYGCNAAVDYGDLIENNMLWNIQQRLGGNVENSSFGRSALAVQRNTATAIQNNTIVGGRAGVELSGLPGSGTTALTFIDNLVSGTSGFGLIVYPSVDPDNIDTNLVYKASGDAVCFEAELGTSDCGTCEYACSSGDDAFYTSAEWPGLGTGNTGTQQNFLLSTGPAQFWNLKLDTGPDASTGVPKVGAWDTDTGCTGATEDIDADDRPDADCDIGADEFSLETAPSNPTVPQRPSAPVRVSQ